MFLGWLPGCQDDESVQQLDINDSVRPVNLMTEVHLIAGSYQREDQMRAREKKVPAGEL